MNTDGRGNKSNLGDKDRHAQKKRSRLSAVHEKGLPGTSGGNCPQGFTHMLLCPQMTLTNQQVAEKMWQWTLFGLHGTQPTSMEQPIG